MLFFVKHGRIKNLSIFVSSATKKLKFKDMFKGHPKGLYVAFFSNMGERFGFYTMFAIFVLFLQAKYGFDSGRAGQIWGGFLAAVYFLPLIGGFLADKLWGYGRTISIGLVTMFTGYFLLALPSARGEALWLVILALGVISLGTGMFKGNLQALVGNMYDDPKYSKIRDVAFNIFYMGINIGAMFAPTTARAVYSYIMKGAELTYNPAIPALANKFLNHTATGENISELLVLAGNQVHGITESGLAGFSTKYIDTLSKAYHFGFGVACISLIISMIIFWGFRKYYRHADLTEKQKAASAEYKDKIVTLTPEQTRSRLIALGLVFGVVIFFWMAFHQNGLTMTMFARDYTQERVPVYVYFWFDLWGLLATAFSIGGLVFLVRKSSTIRTRIISGLVMVVSGYLAYKRMQTYNTYNEFTPEMFQHLNPFFIVILTPIIVGFFTWLNKKGREPSAPRKIGIGMIITAVGFLILVIGSLSLIGYSPKEIGEIRIPDENLAVTPYWLISTYFTLTIAELFLSPMGISFVSKVSPPQYKGLMQGGWLAATAVGNYLVGMMGYSWRNLPLWGHWLVLVICCCLSAIFIFSVIKRLERTTS
jgi:POT family proton-dependent oligopeptide transporter